MPSNVNPFAMNFAQDQGMISSVPRINIGTFCLMPDTAQIMQVAAQDRRMSKAHVSLNQGGISAATQYYMREQTPHLVIVESRGDRDKILAELGEFAQVCGSQTKVIVVGQVNDIQLYRALMDQHVSDYLVAPLNPLQIIDAISRGFNDPKAAPLGRVVAFIGAKGGVGSSTLAHHVAYASSKQLNVETILTDLDLNFGTAALNFNQTVSGTLYDALSAPDRVDTTLLDRLMLKLGNKLNLLSGPASLDRDFPIEAHAVETVINVVRHAAPVVVIDVPNSWSPWIKQTLLSADDIVITATPDLACLRNAKNMLDLLAASRRNDSKPRLVLNQVGVAKRPEIPTAEFAGALGLHPTAVIDHDPQVFGAAQGNGQMIFELSPHSDAAASLSDLAQKVVGGGTATAIVPERVRGGLDSFLQKIPLLNKKFG